MFFLLTFTYEKSKPKVMGKFATFHLAKCSFPKKTKLQYMETNENRWETYYPSWLELTKTGRYPDIHLNEPVNWKVLWPFQTKVFQMICGCLDSPDEN